MNGASALRVVWSAVAGVACVTAHADGITDALNKMNDAIKRADEKLQQAQQPKPVATQASTQSAATPQTGTSQKSNAPASSVVPDIIGLKLGMTPTEVSTVIKGRKLTYDQFPLTMQYFASTGGATPVPGGTFINVSRGYLPRVNVTPLTIDEPFRDFVQVDYMPIPGKERVVRVIRTVKLDKEHYILESELVRSITEKYGTPVQNSNEVGKPTFWRLGTLPVTKERNEIITANCGQPGNAVLDAQPNNIERGRPNPFNTNFALDFGTSRQPSAAKPHPQEDIISMCGNAFVIAKYRLVNEYTAPPEQHLVSEYSIMLTDYQAAFESYKVAAAMISAAQANQSKQQSDKAKGQRPDL